MSQYQTLSRPALTQLSANVSMENHWPRSQMGLKSSTGIQEELFPRPTNTTSPSSSSATAGPAPPLCPADVWVDSTAVESHTLLFQGQTKGQKLSGYSPNPSDVSRLETNPCVLKGSLLRWMVCTQGRAATDGHNSSEGSIRWFLCLPPRGPANN